MLNKGLWKFPVCSRSVKSDSAIELHVQKPSYLGGKCTQSLPSSALWNRFGHSTSPRANTVPPPSQTPNPTKHPFAFSNTLFYFAYVYFLPPASSLSPASPFSLSPHFSFAPIYVYIFICTPTHLSLPLSSSWVAASLFSPPVKHSLGPSVTRSSRKTTPGEFVTSQKHLALFRSRQAEAGRVLRF